MNMSDNKHLIAYELFDNNDIALTTAPVDRDWMDASEQRFAYRCLPLAIANQAGWLIYTPTTFTVYWDGGNSKENVSILFEPPGHTDYRITSHFGSGTFTISMPYLFRTPASVNLWVKGP